MLESCEKKSLGEQACSSTEIMYVPEIGNAWKMECAPIARIDRKLSVRLQKIARVGSPPGYVLRGNPISDSRSYKAPPYLCYNFQHQIFCMFFYCYCCCCC